MASLITSAKILFLPFPRVITFKTNNHFNRTFSYQSEPRHQILVKGTLLIVIDHSILGRPLIGKVQGSFHFLLKRRNGIYSSVNFLRTPLQAFTLRCLNQRDAESVVLYETFTSSLELANFITYVISWLLKQAVIKIS